MNEAKQIEILKQNKNIKIKAVHYPLSTNENEYETHLNSYVLNSPK